MAAGEQLWENPFDLMICDTDALIQIFCANQESILKKLRTRFGIHAAVTEAVESEMLRPGRRRGECCQTEFRKALETGLITVLDRRTLGRFTTNDPQSTYDSIQLLGQKHNNVIDRGEAYTYAAAHILRSAVLSNDGNALRRADALRLETGKPILRLYDLIVFLHQCDEFSEKECDDIRKSLRSVGDAPHEMFAARKFSEGLPHFYPRLINSEYPLVGSENMTELGDENRVEIRALATPSSKQK
jgi:hypothetical protein